MAASAWRDLWICWFILSILARSTVVVGEGHTRDGDEDQQTLTAGLRKVDSNRQPHIHNKKGDDTTGTENPAEDLTDSRTNHQYSKLSRTPWTNRKLSHSFFKRSFKQSPVYVRTRQRFSKQLTSVKVMSRTRRAALGAQLESQSSVTNNLSILTNKTAAGHSNHTTTTTSSSKSQGQEVSKTTPSEKLVNISTTMQPTHSSTLYHRNRDRSRDDTWAFFSMTVLLSLLFFLVLYSRMWKRRYTWDPEALAIQDFQENTESFRLILPVTIKDLLSSKMREIVTMSSRLAQKISKQRRQRPRQSGEERHGRYTSLPVNDLGTSSEDEVYVS